MNTFSRFTLIFLLEVVSCDLFGQRAEIYFLAPGPELTVPAGGSVDLKIVNMTLRDYPSLYEAVWTINNQDLQHQDRTNGHLSQGNYLGAAVYTAPDKVPAKNKITIVVTFKLSDTSKTTLYLLCAITITDVENYMYINTSLCKDYLEFNVPKDAFSRMNMGTAIFANGEFNINVFGLWKKDTKAQLTMSLFTVKNAVGTYPWKLKYTKNEGVISPSNKIDLRCSNYQRQMIMLSSADCMPHNDTDCQPVTLDGSTRITVYDTQKKLLQGYFQGTVVGSTTKGEYYYGTVYGRFTVHLK